MGNEKESIPFVHLHCHTEESLKDSGLSVKDLVDKAVEMNMPAIALTDHGVMAGIIEFMSYARDINEKAGKQIINAIPGVECYYEGKHCVLLGMDYEHGYKALIQAVSESYKHIESSNGHPQMNEEILKKWFGPGSIGHGYVIALSGCMSGVLFTLMNSNEEVDKKLEKLNKKIKGCNNPEDKYYLERVESLKAHSEMINELIVERDSLAKISGKSFVKREKTVAALKDKNPEEYEKQKVILEKEKQESKVAKERVEELKAQIKKERSKETLLRNNLKEIEKTHAAYIFCKKEIDYLKSSIKNEKELYDVTKKEAEKFIEIFGKDNFFIEIQNHRIKQEVEIFPKLLKLAKELNIGFVATNDVHNATATERDIRVRQVQRFQRYGKYEKLEEYHYHMHMKSSEEMLEILSEIISEEDAKTAMENSVHIASLCNVVFTKENHYPKFKTENGMSANDMIRKLAHEAIEDRFSKEEWTKDYADRLEYELDVICGMGYADYHLIVQDFLKMGRKLGKLSQKSLDELSNKCDSMDYDGFVQYVDSHQEELGYTIGPGRGSAAGSLVCFLLGITNIDPIKYGLLFERFLNVERVSMPDIDSDISPDVRELVIEYIKKRYGEESVCCILTKGTMAAKASIRAAARFLGAEKKDDSLYYYRLGDEISKSIPSEPGMSIVKAEEQLTQYVESVENPELKEVSKEIVQLAQYIERCQVSYGMHAAGVVIADNGNVGEYLPLLYNDKERWCCQCDMIQVEENGLLKMDALGLMTMKIITDTIRKIKKNYGIVVDMDKIPFEAEVFSAVYAKGKTNGVFQFESNGMKQMLTEFKPDSIHDVILLVAAYRPGPMQYLDDIISRKHRRMETQYLIPELKDILGATYASIIYQEQVQQIFQKLAGYSLGQADLVRRAMSKKKEKVLLAERVAFVNGDASRNIHGCVANGISEQIANQLFDGMIDFAKYAFNKSHAAAYAVVSYQTAWLKHHYPAEFLCATMNTKEIKELPLYFEECKNYGVKIESIDINYSDEVFTDRVNDDGSVSIIFGLSNVKGIKSASTQIVEARHNGYESFYEYMMNGHMRKNITENLIKAGAFDRFCENRAALLSVLDEYCEILKKIKKKTSDIKELKTSLNEEKTEKGKKSLLQSLNRAEKALMQYNQQMKDVAIPSIVENRRTKLDEEFDVLGAYVSGHPLDIYTSDYPVTSFSEMISGKEYYALVLLQDLRVVERKKDGKPLAFFSLSDKTLTVDGQCFTKAYEKIGKQLKNQEAYVMKGKYQETNSFATDEESDFEVDVQRSFAISDIYPVNVKRKSVIINLPVIDWPYIRMALKTMENENCEYQVILSDTLGSGLRMTDTLADLVAIQKFNIPYQMEV